MTYTLDEAPKHWAVSPNALLIGVGRAADHRHNLEREPGLFLQHLVQEYPPPSLVHAVCDAGWTPGLEALANNTKAVEADQDLRDRLTATGDPRVAVIVLSGTTWTQRDRRRVLAAADLRPEREPSWRRLREWLFGNAKSPSLRSAVVCPFPGVPEYVLRVRGTDLTRAEQLRALLSVHTHGGVDALWTALEDLREPGTLHADVRDLLDAAIATPAGVEALRVAVVDAEGTQGLIAELRDADTYDAAAGSVSRREDIDGDALRAAHEALPFGPEAARALVEHTDCPARLVAALCMTHPRPAELLGVSATTPPGALLLELPPKRVTTKVLTILVERCLGHDLSGDDLFDHARPAKVVLELAHRAGESPSLVWTAFHARLAELVRTGPGTDPSVWREIADRLNRFRGTVSELVEEARHHAGTTQGPSSPWPHAGELPGHTATPRLDARRAAFVALTDAADDDALEALLPHLDDRTAYDVVVHGRWRPTRLPELITGAPSRERTLTARHRRLPADSVAPLAALDDADVNAGLIYQIHANGRLLLDLVQGVPRHPGANRPRVELAPTLVAELLAPDTLVDRRWLAPFVGSGDPALIAAALARVRLNTRHLQLKLALGQWERGGREQVVLPDWALDTTKQLITSLRAEPDPDAALQKLREHVHDCDSPTSLARRLHSTTARSLPQLLNEGYRWDWAAVETEFTHGRLHHEILADLAELPGCPRTLRPGPRETTFVESRPPTPAAVLRGLARRRLHTDDAWAKDALDQGTITPEDLLRHARPVIGLPVEPIHRDPVARTTLEHLIREHLDGNPQAWVVALRLSRDFEGTLPELITTAAKATS
ncbi:hypothetical protein ACIRL2_47005 [Embleya sp. NPDC127516]|uniref:hypothetical protein n=1 Tax=Embleya sp. NPDC127516 TaxID=3363990 RepID=UPI00382513EC